MPLILLSGWWQRDKRYLSKICERHFERVPFFCSLSPLCCGGRETLTFGWWTFLCVYESALWVPLLCLVSLFISLSLSRITLWWTFLCGLGALLFFLLWLCRSLSHREASEMVILLSMLDGQGRRDVKVWSPSPLEGLIVQIFLSFFDWSFPLRQVNLFGCLEN